MTTWVDAQNTFPGSRSEWITTRRDALKLAIDSAGPELASGGAGGYAAALEHAAELGLGQWAWESGYGQHEYRYNGAGVHCQGAALCQRLASGSSAGDLELRAYDSLDEAAADWLRIVRQYPAAWLLLQQGNLQWLNRLVRDGYTVQTPNLELYVNEYPTVVRSIASALSTDPWWTDAEFAAARALGRPATSNRRRRSGGSAVVWGGLAVLFYLFSRSLRKGG